MRLSSCFARNQSGRDPGPPSFPCGATRARYLLEQNRKGALSDDEAAELEQLGQL